MTCTVVAGATAPESSPMTSEETNAILVQLADLTRAVEAVVLKLEATVTLRRAMTTELLGTDPLAGTAYDQDLDDHIPAWVNQYTAKSRRGGDAPGER